MSDYLKGQEGMSLPDFSGILPVSTKGYTALLDNHKQQRGKLLTHVDILTVSTEPAIHTGLYIDGLTNIYAN
jgi:hypothetical protein